MTLYFTDDELAVLHTFIEGALECAKDDDRTGDARFFESMFNETLMDVPSFSIDQLAYLRENLSDYAHDMNAVDDHESEIFKSLSTKLTNL